MDSSNNGPLSSLLHFRKATCEDIQKIQALINLSVRKLHPPFYKPTVISKALEQVTAIDLNHVNDGKYFLVEIKPSSSGTVSAIIIGCSGWSHRTTLYGNDLHTSHDPALLDPAVDAARVRALFTHPDWTKKGIASMLLKACEEDALEAGFRTVELSASLQAVAFYEKNGYQKIGIIDRELGGEDILELVMMKKRLV